MYKATCKVTDDFPLYAFTSGALHPATLRLLYDFRRLKTDAAEHHAVANSIRSPLTPEQLCQRRGETFAPGLSYTAHWEALGSALRLLTTRAISYTGPVWGRGSGPSSCNPRARVACVVWAWDLFVTWRLCRGLPAPVGLQFFALRL
jgi:hypothetical protein